MILTLFIASNLLWIIIFIAIIIAVPRGTLTTRADGGKSGFFKGRAGSPMYGDDSVPLNEYQTIFNSITDSICIVNKEFRISHVNKSYAEMTGKSAVDLCGTLCHEMFRGRALLCEECPAMTVFTTKKPVLQKKMDGWVGETHRYYALSAYPIFDKDEEVVHVVEFIRDITDETLMLEQIIRSEKLAGVGLMTTGIAHEMNNALSGVAGTASNLLSMPEKYGLNEKGINRVFSILDSATRATLVMKKLLQLADPMQEETRIMVNIRHIINKTIKGVFIEGAPDFDREVQFGDLLPPIKADVPKMEIVLTNLFTNAVQAIKEMAALKATEGVLYRGSLWVTVHRHETGILITVADNGIGIEESVAQKIFDPFFSSWPQGRFTGLGLSIALRIIEEHEGRISFERILDKTIFSILLPVERKRKINGLTVTNPESART